MGINKSNQLQRVRRGLVLYLDSKDFTNSPPTSIHRDRSGNGNDATPSNFGYTPTSGADLKGGLVYGGTSENEIVAHSGSISFNGDFTIEYVLSGTSTTATETILNKAVSSGNSIGYGIHLRNTAPYIKFFVYDTAIKSTSVCNLNVRDGKKHVIQCIKSGNNLKLKIDGVLISDDTLSIGSFANTSPLYIGENYNNNTPQYFFKGTTYIVAMYNVALTNSELNQNYNVSK